jgi:type II secretory pathway component PulC
MRKLKGSDLTAATWQAQAFGVLRPSVEAALLAGVALGCAQIGWDALTAPTADASNASPLESVEAPGAVQEVRSPFSPSESEASHASATLVANVGLAGVRMSDDPSRSGAVLTLEGGAQRAFMVGQEVAPGVRLSAVSNNKVLLAFDGGSKELVLAAAPTMSYAMALMGRGTIDASAAAAAPAPVQVAAADPNTPFELSSQPEALGALAAPVTVSPSGVVEQASAAGASRADMHWLSSTMSQVEQAEGGEAGWRIGAEPPSIAAAAGLRQGDLILSVNGAGPNSGVDLLSVMGAGPVEIAVERGGKRITLSLETTGRS